MERLIRRLLQETINQKPEFHKHFSFPGTVNFKIRSNIQLPNDAQQNFKMMFKKIYVF